MIFLSDSSLLKPFMKNSFLIVVTITALILLLIGSLEYFQKQGYKEEPSNETGIIYVTILPDPYPGQSKDMRIGLQIPETSTRWSSSPNMNFLANYGFEEYEAASHGEIAVEWRLWSDGDWPDESTQSQVTFSRDGSAGNFIHGKYSQKISVTRYVEPVRFGQFQSGRQFLAGRTYKFGCWMKQDGLTGDIRLRVRLWCGDSRIDLHKNLTVGSQWNYYEMDVILPVNCTPIDPYYGQASSVRVEIFSQGTLWIDDAQFYDSEAINEWGLSKIFVEEIGKLKPSTLRYGGLGCNSLLPENIFGNRFDLSGYRSWNGEYGGDPFDFNQFLKLCELTGANPDYVLSQHFIVNPILILNLLEYMYGNNGTTYGLLREKSGFESWSGKFQKVYFELGNEVMFNINGPNWSPEEYADYVVQAIKVAKSSPYWDSSIHKIGIGLQYANVWVNVPLLRKLWERREEAMVDFIMVAEYFPGHEFTNYYSTGEVSYSERSLTSSSEGMNVWYRRALGEAAYNDKYVSYLKEMINENYPGPGIGIYEYGVTGVFKREPYNHVLANMETSLGSAIALLDLSVNMRKNGLDPINFFYAMGLEWTWGLMGDYPHFQKRPVYYALQIYGEFQRGELLECTYSCDAFDPYGDSANSHVIWSDFPRFGLEKQYYPVKVPILTVYPFKSDERYSFLLINKDLEKSIRVQLNVPYEPSSRAIIVSLTGGSPHAGGDESQENVSLNYLTVYDFTGNYTIILPPHSVCMIVNYEKNAEMFFDEAVFGAKISESNNPYSKTLVGPNPNIHIEPGS